MPKQNLGIYVINQDKLYWHPIEKQSGQKGAVTKVLEEAIKL
ncbi:MAG: hypothetical protein ABSF00_05915 [Candidatus Bathyarchaeia archaeon]|jgi:hypothetical protein